MPPPTITGSQIQRAPTFAPTGNLHLEPIDEAADEIQSVAGEIPPMPEAAPEVPPDPALSDVVENGVGPDLQPGDGQMLQFGAAHSVSAGRDWDMNTAEGLLETVRNSVAHFKEQISGKKAIDNCVNAAIETAARLVACEKIVGDDVDKVADDVAELRRISDELKAARAGLLAGISEGDGASAMEKLDGIKKALRVFRFETQKALDELGFEAGAMGFNESNLRTIQNAFTFGIDYHVEKTDFEKIADLERELEGKLRQLSEKLDSAAFSAVPKTLSKAAKFFDNVGAALELSHRTNDQIRAFQETDSTAATIRDIVGEIAEKGGRREVEFSVGVGVLAGLGFSEALTAGVRAGARIRIVGTLETEGAGRPISVMFRIAGGLEAKGMAVLGDESKFAGAKAVAMAGGELSHFTVRNYPTLDDFILDAKRNKFAMSRTVGAAILGGLKSFGKSVGSLGSKFFGWLGRKSGEVRQNASQYLGSLKARHIVGRLDRVLSRRTNPNIVGESSGWTWGGFVGAGANADLIKGYINAGVSINYSHEHDFSVKSKAYAPLVKVVMDASDTEALQRLCGRDPHGALRPIERYEDELTSKGLYKTIVREFTRIVDSVKHLEQSDKTGFAGCAYNLRALVLSTELAVRENRLSRDDAKRIYALFAAMDVTFPKDIYREYFMVGLGAAKPPKVRDSVTIELNASFFKDWTGGLASGVGNPILQAAAEGGITEMRHQIGLDTTFQYRFSSERPVDKNSDPRPWENVKRTTHSLAVSASTPARIIIEAVTRTIANKGEKLENKSENVALDTVKAVAKDIPKDAARGALIAALPGIILASVKETAVAAVKNWLSKPENIQKLVDFVLDHLGDAFEFIINAVEWVVENPNTALHVASSIYSASSLGDAQRNKVVSWSFVDGKLEGISVHSESKSRIGVNVDPVGVGVGVGFDVSYSVTEAIKDRAWFPNPSLKALLSVTTDFLASETGLDPSGAGAPLKNWMARNSQGVEKILAGLLTDNAATRELVETYSSALLVADGDYALQEKLQAAWRQLRDLPPDATPDAKVDAVHDLLVCIVLAHNRPR